jgi:hypothetical protein
VVLAVEAMGTRVAAVQFAEGPPLVLLADHVEGDRPILVYRVADLGAALVALAARGWERQQRLEIPQGPCCSFRTPRGPPHRPVPVDSSGGGLPLRGALRLLTAGQQRIPRRKGPAASSPLGPGCAGDARCLGSVGSHGCAGPVDERMAGPCIVGRPEAAQGSVKRWLAQTLTWPSRKCDNSKPRRATNSPSVLAVSARDAARRQADRRYRSSRAHRQHRRGAAPGSPKARV